MDVEDNGNGLVDVLNAACEQRVARRDICFIRLPVWDWLIENLPQAFSPRGRNDAEILPAFQSLCRNDAFSPFLWGSSCDDYIRSFQMPLPVPSTSISVAYGFLPHAIAEGIANFK